ncbi:HET-domain-containing protein [Botryosphaeria dothidea]|uniref:HET-domain-containing protein n=1 Tax=Botryosphaeria dothidea TaxID=55169 RepID=A0A8H4IQ57_9PEZI|nr:HET-domain-containing protein [Botryosphaeria dothidea]
MDAASLIIGIPGLLNDCLELLERVNSMREFENESRHAIALWDASKMGLRAWAEDVGLDNKSSEKVHHPRLEDAEIMEVVKKNLQSIQDICKDEIEIRPEVSAEQSENGPEILECKISEADVREDITSFSAAVVNEMLPSKKEDVRLGLADQMAHKSEGMFLWIKMQKNQLKDTKNHKQLQKLINDMPSGLPSTYERNWRDIQKLSPEEQDRAEAIFRWVAFSFRPLTVLELTEALILNADVESNILCQDDMPDEINDAKQIPMVLQDQEQCIWFIPQSKIICSLIHI